VGRKAQLTVDGDIVEPSRQSKGSASSSFGSDFGWVSPAQLLSTLNSNSQQLVNMNPKTSGSELLAMECTFAVNSGEPGTD
jgi:hypothetical protein